MRTAQWTILVVFLAIIFICLYLWHVARKQLTPEQKKIDVAVTSKQDLLCLCVLLIGYLFLAYYPNIIAFKTYLIIGIFIGIIMEFHNYYRLKKSDFPRSYFKWAILYSFILWFVTITLGIFLLLSF